MMNSHEYRHEHEKHSDSLVHELIHHFPYAVFSVAISLIFLSLVSNMIGDGTNPALIKNAADSLFHSFHFLHIVFSATGTVLTFLRFSKRSWWWGVLVGILSPIIFCTLSDAILPYFGGRMFGVHMHWHLCFHTELANVIPFLLIGVVNGFIMGRHHASRVVSFSVKTHFAHVLISSLASSLYLLAHGFLQWEEHIGLLFVFLLFAVLLPCTASDVIVPMMFAKPRKK